MSRSRSPRVPLLVPVLVMVLVMLPQSGGQLNCDVSSAASLSGCLRTLLETSRERLTDSLDPLQMEDRSTGGLNAANITVLGLSAYRVQATSAKLLSNGGFGLRARVTWKHLHAVLDATMTRCRTLLVELCYKVRARPLVLARRAAADLSTTLRLTFGAEGLTFAPHNTDVRLQIGNITVQANLEGELGELNKALDDPASRAITQWADEWWQQDRWRVERRATDALDRLIRDKLGGRIRELLIG